ncbi:MAG: VWA domain-containing protein [gamma proteobacterium symbiont of Bathyaustriella thionipta]|nr:VWA domain-containing protein [gamma proteobacterium symbiont of Bathyaustriella thionipta]MCU7948984.1 VWA domain-containing protein [gamma proteobacterium symbiont of Bathyaustriella thionipta]MCU7953448.1 VWA domain-containing protein [gamma proteobacterium symbiont of Bathyaustriella thionipta]MCU7955548.1 VWA domain-containing protein [gamma proteobacterium symbiont of Bathyaustriella thionipta]MCU7967420.1 VWA domain-containing protein [gamma proteobacterium symbiont of Bathyaustriella
MSIKLEDYEEFLEDVPAIRDVLEGTFHEAARIMSPAGLEDYLDGAKALSNLGRGPDLVITYLQEMPLVVKECGEDIIPDCLSAAMKLSSMTSGEVISLLFSSLPAAARNLGDAELLRGYLTFIHQLASTASRGLRPMLNHMDDLLSKLTLSGLRRWANFGAQAYRRDYANLTLYFNLESADSKAMLQKERRGVLFIKVQRKLNFYLRALWGRDFFLRPTGADYTDFRPYVEHRILHMPDAVDDLEVGEGQDKIPGLELYRATAAHMASHMCYSTSSISAEQLSPAQMFFIGFMEDARVEYKASNDFPGLQKLWLALLKVADHDDEPEHPTLKTLEHIAVMLLDSKHEISINDEQINAFVDKFYDEIEARQDDNNFSWHMGMELFNLFAARKEVPSLRILERIRIPYRDDNRFVWEFEEFDWSVETEYVPASQRQVRKQVSVIEMANEVDCELVGDDAQEIWTCSTNMRPYEDDLTDEQISFNDMWGKEPVSDPFHYQEWDYQIQLHRPDWATVYERRQPKGDPEDIHDILTAYKPIAHRIKQIIDLLTPEGVQRQRGLEDGDEVDINAAVDAMISIRMGEQPNPRITMRNVIKNRDLSVVVLMDLSESTNETMAGSDKTVLQLTREAATLVATAINGIGDPFALHGFASDGRHDVQYYRFKDFNQHFDDEVKSCLSGMKGGLSTRMGAALRHAGHHLLKQQERRKLILLVTDGEPADIDERDPQHLRHDTKKAVEELYTNGVLTYCLTLDPNADNYVKRIFGENNYTIIDNVDRLPEKLPTLFASLTG